MAAACGGSASAPIGVGEPAAAPAPSEPASGRVVRVGHGPEGVAVDPARGLVAVATRSPNRIEVLDPDGQPVRSVDLPASTRHLRFAAQPGLPLAPLERAGAVAPIDVQAGKIVDRVPLRRQPHDVVAVAARAFVSNEFSDTLAVVESGRVLRELPALAQPGGVAAAATAGGAPAGSGPTHTEGDARSRMFVVDTLGGAVLVFSVRARLIQMATALAPGRPCGIAVASRLQRLWVTETATDRLADTTSRRSRRALLPRTPPSGSRTASPWTAAPATST